MTLTMENLSEIFMIQSLEGGDGVTIEETDVVTFPEGTFRYPSGIDKIVMELANAKGIYALGKSKLLKMKPPSLQVSLFIFPRSASNIQFENTGKVAWRGKTEIGPDSGQRFIRISDEALCFLRFFFQDEICDIFPCILLELLRQVWAAHIQRSGNILRFNCI